ncbi:MAG: alpha-amylase, partial [Calditrichaeota bacterium]|nr:alpha-amylase [Calditrichota bacterium]
FAYSNRYRGERTLVVFHNAYADCRGWIRTSAAFSEKDSEGQSKVLRQRTLGEGLALPSGEDDYLIFRDQINGLEYIYHARTLWEQGMYIELGAYKYQVFLDFREVRDDASRSYARLNASLQGRGVPSIDEALQELHLQPIHQALREFVNPDFLQQLLPAADTVGEASTDTRPDEAILDDLETRYQNFLEAGKAYGGFQE